MKSWQTSFCTYDLNDEQRRSCPAVDVSLLRVESYLREYTHPPLFKHSTWLHTFLFGGSSRLLSTRDVQKAQEWIAGSGVLLCQVALNIVFQGFCDSDKVVPRCYLRDAPLIPSLLAAIGHRLTRLALRTPVVEFIAFMLAIESVTCPLLEHLEIHPSVIL